MTIALKLLDLKFLKQSKLKFYCTNFVGGAIGLKFVLVLFFINRQYAEYKKMSIKTKIKRAYCMLLPKYDNISINTLNTQLHRTLSISITKYENLYINTQIQRTHDVISLP